ncbi:50S ribosomal protein L6 [Candidatus Berkelbacteria bacterium]|nr:50S ribosomal protein L6 [Candidatus Berkelbacteria bacterium]
MSRLGRLPIALPAGVTVDQTGPELTIAGSRGSLTHRLPTVIELIVGDEQLIVQPKKGQLTRKTKPLYGLTRQLIANMVHGVTAGFSKKLEMKGTGYRAELQGNGLVLQVGFSHPVTMNAPDGITFAVEKNLVISVQGNDKQQVGAVAAQIRAIRKPEPYKGKGIRYAGEQIRLKPGKAAKAQAG